MSIEPIYFYNKITHLLKAGTFLIIRSIIIYLLLRGTIEFLVMLDEISKKRKLKNSLAKNNITKNSI